MADSPYLKFQDTDGDGLQEECKDVVPVSHPNKCPECVPNPTYVGPNWLNQTEDDPWFDEKNCKYKVTIKTSYDKVTPSADATGADAAAFMAEMSLEYAETAIDAILLSYEKENTPEIRENLIQHMTLEKFDLDPRAFSRVKLLYSINYDYIAPLDSADESDDEEDSSSTQEDDITVKYNARSLKSKTIKAGKIFRYYSRLYRVYSYVHKNSLVFENGKLYSVKQLDRYGINRSQAQGGGGAMVNMFHQLDNWLNSKGYNILEGFDWAEMVATKNVKDIELVFSGNRKLKEVRVWTHKCRNKPKVYKGKQLKSLNNRSGWKDRTACNYFMNLENLIQAASARAERPWVEVMEEVTYPKLKTVKNYGKEESTDSVNQDSTLSSCVADSLKGEFKELGQDILDDVMSIGDALASMFHESVCKLSMGEKLDEDFIKGLAYNPNYFPPGGTQIVDATTKEQKEAEKTIGNMAIEQAFANIEADEQLFTTICTRVLGSAVGRTNKGWPAFTGFSPTNAGSAQAFLDDVYKHGFDRMKICGLFDFLLEAIRCLLGGLTLEEALARAIKSALKAMSIEDFGKLFVGLPPEKQAELDALVKKKLNEGDIFQDGSQGQQLSDAIDGKKPVGRPWDSSELIDREREKRSNRPDAPYEGMSSKQLQEYNPSNKRTLAQQFDVNQIQQNASNELSPDVIMEAYALALIEVWGDNLLGLVDKLNDFPGAPIIAKIFATLDCPRPPLFDPNFLDFINSIEIPICKFPNELVLPKLINPFGWLPALEDIAKLVFMLIVWAIQTILMMVIMRIIMKLCELIGDAICKALEILGKAAASLVTGGASLSDIIKESICGPEASPQQVQDTLTEMMEKLGTGGAALSNKEDVENFFSDVSNSVTREELFNSLLGDTSSAMGNVVDNLLEYEYPQFRDGLPDAASVADFFGNMGNLLPAAVKDQMKQLLKDLPDDDELPANPSLCLNEDDVKEFQDLRCAMLEGRATSEQCRAMFDSRKLDLLDDLESLSDVLQNPQEVLMDALPPIVSDPGCDNGLIPFESDEMLQAASVAMGGNFKQLKIDFTKDMIGPLSNGLFMGRKDSKWGMMNMIMSDTMGNPLSVHWNKAQNRNYTDFVTKEPESLEAGVFGALYPAGWSGPQRGQFPTEVATHLKEEMTSLSLTYSSNNNYKEDKKFKRSFEKLGWTSTFGNPDFSIISVPDFGYNSKYVANYESEMLEITRYGRKKDPDIQLDFRDNNTGVDSKIAAGETKPWSYGFRINVFNSDMEDNSNIGTRAEPKDVTRVSIFHKFNTAGKLQEMDLQSLSEADYERLMKTKTGRVLSDRFVEFISVENTLESIAPNQYPAFRNCFANESRYTPQIVLLKEMIDEDSPTGPGLDTLKGTYNTFMNAMYQGVTSEIASNENAFSYGAVNDTLNASDMDYGVERGGSFVLYEDAKNDDGDDLSNDDMELGLSRDAYNNKSEPKKIRVHYLSPTKYGGTYTNPPVYVKPVTQEGWMGFLSVLFPEYTVCKPRKSELIDFKSIRDEVDEAYNQIPLDPRLKEDKDCVIERPYNRILNRPAIATIQGIIKSSCRIFASTHMIKSLASFTTFYPDFDNVYGGIYASYIVEHMEKSFRDAQGPFWEFFNPFSDDEFWYSFLEQVVQTYGRLVDSGEINPPEHIIDMLIELNDVQEGYKYPFKKELKIAHSVGETDLPVRPKFMQSFSLKKYRSQKNLEIVQSSEELAKMILREMVIGELNIVGKKMVDNIESLDLKPKYTDARKYFITNYTNGGIDLDLHKELKEEVIGLPTEGSGYTTGGEFSVLSTGEPYTGYYHIHYDEDEEMIYMEGEYHTEEAHETIIPLLSRTGLPFGDFQEFTSETSYVDDPARPFLIEKYMAINGVKMNTSTAISMVASGGPEKNISDIYPGDMRLVYPPTPEGESDQDAEPVGVSGNLGVTYGLQISLIVGGQKVKIAETEISALDTKCTELAPLQGSTKLLYCLLVNLMDEDKFKLLTDYVFPIKNVISTIAIYNDMGFLPSIGEKTVADGNSYASAFSIIEPTFDDKPGVKISARTVTESAGILTTNYSYSGKEGWTSYKDRQPNWFESILFNHWDNWDKELLRNTKSRIKKIFRKAYNDRDFDLTGGSSDGTDAASQAVKDAMSQLMPSPGAMFLPWWKKGKLRPNPFDKNGNLCSPVGKD